MKLQPEDKCHKLGTYCETQNGLPAILGSLSVKETRQAERNQRAIDSPLVAPVKPQAHRTASGTPRCLAGSGASTRPRPM